MLSAPGQSDQRARDRRPDANRSEGRPALPFPLCVLLLAPLMVGCVPIVDIAGVYFPAWLVSVVIAIVASYALVAWLGRRPSGRALADSGVFFVGLVTTQALALWWVFFSRF